MTDAYLETIFALLDNSSCQKETVLFTLETEYIFIIILFYFYFFNLVVINVIVHNQSST